MNWLIGIYVVVVLVHAYIIGLGNHNNRDFAHHLLLCLFWPVLLAIIIGETVSDKPWKKS